jgi:hypothetical protein
VFWSFRENLGGLDHINKALCRRIFGLAPDRYLHKIIESDPQKYRAVMDDLDQPLACRLCGYQLLHIELIGFGFATICSSQAHLYVKNVEEIAGFARSLPLNEQ